MRTKEKKDRAILPKPKLIVQITSKIASKGPKSAKKGPNVAEINTKMGLYFHAIQVLSAFKGFSMIQSYILQYIIGWVLGC